MEIKFENVTKKFGSITAVAELSFIIPARKLVCVVGPSGCGKTTLLSLLAGLLAPDAGRIHLNGQLASDDKIRLAPQAREIGMVFQSLALWPHMT
ncbi:MAG: ATP-binding cassette domain-containing protein, partial [Planctomycetes bacterium]|nr:ATP-binding cassette domain-containing protein [Planctomycetota bacterium]